MRYWLGQFDGADFSVATAKEGLLLDHGPDFYAGIVDSPTPASEVRRLVAWASNWETARSMPWPGGIHGGPMTLPRLLSFDPASRRLVQRPGAGIAPTAVCSWDGAAARVVTIAGKDAQLVLALDRRGLHVRRNGLDGLLDWEHSNPGAFADDQAQTISIFNDAGLIEVFIAPIGLTVTAFVPGAQVQAIV